MPRAYDAETLTKEISAGTLRTAMFAQGCFWGPDGRFGSVPGVVQSRVGYAGSAEANPEYRIIRGHAEVLRVAFDPERVSYGDLVQRYLQWHTPRRIVGQYRSIVFYGSAEEKAQAEAILGSRDPWPTLISTETDEGRFWDAEAYHQKHTLRRSPELVQAMEKTYGPRWDEHTLATKFNAYLQEAQEREALTPWLEDVPPEVTRWLSGDNR